MTREPELPTVSIPIITRNRRDLLNEALASIRELDYPKEKIQVVVVEDTNDPHPPPGVTYIARPDDRQGNGVCRNVSVQASTGEILAFTDDDCIVEKDWLRELLRPLLADATVAGVAGAVHTRDETTLELCWYVLGYPGGGLRYVHASGSKITETRQLNTVNCAYRRQALIEAGAFNPAATRGGEDALLIRRVLERHKCIFNPNAKVYHRSRGTLKGLFMRFFNFGKCQIDILQSGEDQWWLVKVILKESLLLKYILAALLLHLMKLKLTWLLAIFALHYLYVAYSNRFMLRYFKRWDVLAAVPGARFIGDLGMDCGRMWTLAMKLRDRLR